MLKTILKIEYSQTINFFNDMKVQSKTTMILVCLFVGNLGIYRYMMGYSN